jgi:Methyltransferase domain
VIKESQPSVSGSALSQPKDTVIAALLELAEQELTNDRRAAAAYVAQLALSRAPGESRLQRVLLITADALGQDVSPSAEAFCAIGEAHQLLKENEAAALNYREALKLMPNCDRAHMGLATLRMPGDLYYRWLERLYELLSPESVIEIGVANGRSLAHVLPPSIAIGIDPNPIVTYPMKTETHIFAETSNEFFVRRGADALLKGRPLGIGFIDGLHLYEQALQDFIYLEALCGPHSVILIHDTVPLDEATQSRNCDTQFHTGDVWKVLLCLKYYRPDLDIFTIATPWTGLTVVTGVTPGSQILTDKYAHAVKRFVNVPFSEIQDQMDHKLNIVPNDWNLVESRLRANGVVR